MHTKSLLEILGNLEDPRAARGVRHPFAGIVLLMLLGMLARMREMEVVVRWATAHWGLLKEPLGFSRDAPPCATTISRTLAKCRVADLQAALADWFRTVLHEKSSEGVVAVDGKTSKQGIEDGSPLHMLNVFVHDLRVVVAQWSTGAEKTNEPTVLRRHLEELLEMYPMLRLFTGDAIFAQRPLAELICSNDRDYLLQVKANQGDTLDALQCTFAAAAERPPHAESTGKRGHLRKPAGCGPMSTTLRTSAMYSTCLVAA